MELLSAPEVAAILGYNLRHLRTLLRSGKLRGTRVGPGWLITRDAVAAYQKPNRGRPSKRMVTA